MLLFVALIGAAPPSAGAHNPLAPALSGQLECTTPNDAAKTCRSISSYKHLDGPNYLSTLTTLLSPEGPTMFEAESRVVVKGDSICGTFTPEDIKKRQDQDRESHAQLF